MGLSERLRILVRGPDVVAHRGLRIHAPENTIPALQDAFDAGAAGVEIDLRASRDGVPFLVHDYDLQRVAGLPDRVADLDASHLRRIELLSLTATPDHPISSSTRMCVFEEAYGRLANRGRWLVEVKTDERCVEAVARMWSELPPPAGSALISFDRSLCRLARERLPVDVAVGRLHHEGDVGAAMSVPVLEQTLEDGLDMLALHRSHWTRAMVRRCRASRLATMAWTVNRTRDASRLRSMGIEILVSDLPAPILRRMHRGCWPPWLWR